MAIINKKEQDLQKINNFMEEHNTQGFMAEEGLAMEEAEEDMANLIDQLVKCVEKQVTQLLIVGTSSINNMKVLEQVLAVCILVSHPMRIFHLPLLQPYMIQIGILTQEPLIT